MVSEWVCKGSEFGAHTRESYDLPWASGLRVSLWALVMGPFDSQGVCFMGPHFVYCTQLESRLGVQIRGPY